MKLNNNDVKKLQKIELNMLLYFKEICQKNGLKFYLCGGCLIGAIRNGGFIPWDDDVDIFMPRPDYEKLAQIWEKNADNKRYVYCRTNDEECYHDAGASIRDRYTTYINEHSKMEDICHGVALEIMPIDACPKTKKQRIWQLFNAIIFSIFNVQRLPDNKGRVARAIVAFSLWCIPFKTVRNKIWKTAEHEMSKYSWENADYVTELIGSIKGMLIKHPKEDFSNVHYASFEGHTMPIMSGYDRYLKLIWGNFMKLPDVKDRVPKHDVYFMDLDNSYVKYRGIKYCCKE